MPSLLVALILTAWFVCVPAARAGLPAPTQDPPRITLEGRMWIVEAGERRVPRIGSFTVCYYLGDREYADVALNSGAFHCELPAYSYAPTIGRVSIEGREAACVVDESVLESGLPLELEARFLPGARLRVRIRDTGVELKHCIRFDNDWTPPERPLSLPYAVPNWDDDCPAFGWEQVRTVRVRAPGYVWASTDVDLLAGGDYWVDLEREASLTIEVTLTPGANPQLLAIAGPRGWRSQPFVGPRQTFDGLSPGKYRIESHVGGPEFPGTANRAEFELAPGEHRALTVALSPENPVIVAPARGTLQIHGSWEGRFDQAVVIKRRSPMGDCRGEVACQVQRQPDGSFTWNAGALPIGRYFLAAESLAWGTTLEIGEGNGPISLRVPPKVRCSLRLVDSKTREDLAVSSISWRAVAPPSSGALQWRTVERAEGGGFEIEAPAGPLTVCPCSAGPSGYSMRDQVVDLPPGATELTLPLEPIGRIRVHLREGDRIVRFPEGTDPEVRRTDGSDAVEAFDRSANSTTVMSTTDGPVVVSVPAFASFLAPEPVIVVTRPREVVDVVLHLVRAR